MARHRFLWAGVAAAAAAVGIAASGSARPEANIYSTHALVSSGPSVAAAAGDSSLVNGWGLSAGPTTPWWTANNGTNTSTLYNGVGSKQALTVAVPGGPTGTVFNGDSTAFVVSQNGKSGAARFLFATEAGTILGWSPAVNVAQAIPGADRSSAGAIYKGLAIAGGSSMRPTSTTAAWTCSTRASVSCPRAASATPRSRRATRSSESRRLPATSG